MFSSPLPETLTRSLMIETVATSIAIKRKGDIERIIMVYF